MTDIQPTERMEAIDHFRGLAILMMVVANYFFEMKTAPGWLQHAPDPGFTPPDLIAPFFLFAIGLTYGPSFRRRIKRTGYRAAVEHMLVRYLAIAGLGLMLVAGEQVIYPAGSGEDGWGVLQAIGAAGLLTLPFLALPAWARMGAGLVLVGGYQVLLNPYWLPIVLRSQHGGILGGLSWGGFLLIATAMGDLFLDAPKGRRVFMWLSPLLLAAGLVLALLAPISKIRVSASYVLVGLGASGLLFLAFYFLDLTLKPRLPVLTAWGKNPLVLYLLHLFLLGLFVLPPWPFWYVQAPLWLAALQVLALLAMLSVIGVLLERRGWHFSF